MDLFHAKLKHLRKRRTRIELTSRWIPAHLGCQGNEMADEEAKKAAQGDPSPDHKLPRELRSNRTLPISKSALKQQYTRRFKDEALEHFKRSPRFAKFNDLDPNFHPSSYRKLIDGLPRKQAACLAQLRTNHVPLNKHLHRIKCHDTPDCPNCVGEAESVYHFLLRCPAYERPRRELLATLGRDARSLSFLLTDKTAMRPLFRYIARTGRLASTFGDDMELPEGDED